MKVQNAGDPPESEDEEGVINDDQEKGSSSKKNDDDQSKNSGGTAGLTDADIEVLRGKFPILRELSSGFIKGLTPTELMNLEKASMKRGQAERFKDAEDKLTTNRQDLGLSATDVKAGVDDRWTRLHDGRFLGGAGCSATTLWLTARERIELEGHPPISTYDMACMGLAGYITPRGWIELANPASSKLSIRLFNINNITSRQSSSRATSAVEDDAEDFTDLAEFQLALRAMRSAMMMVMPWNFSVAALEGFLINSRYCREDIGALDKQAQILTQFADYITKENSSRWRNKEPFITAGEMRSFWNAFFLARPQSQLTKKKNAASKFAKATGTKEKSAFVNICFHWNRGQCNRAAGSCTSRMGTVLRHVCDMKIDRDDPSKRCEGDHQRCTFHK